LGGADRELFTMIASVLRLLVDVKAGSALRHSG